MFDLAFLQQCADPSIDIAIVERFISEVGTDNPLAITITDGDRLILPEAPRTPEAAMRLIERYVGQTVVRAGVTRYPAGHGITDVSELSPGLVDACENIRMGTKLFAKVLRIIAHDRAQDSGTVFREVIEAWRTGMFEGRYVFGEPDPGPVTRAENPAETTHQTALTDDGHADDPPPGSAAPVEDGDPNKAGIRVDLTAIASEENQ